jgi:hypothetical protein
MVLRWRNFEARLKTDCRMSPWDSVVYWNDDTGGFSLPHFTNRCYKGDKPPSLFFSTSLSIYVYIQMHRSPTPEPAPLNNCVSCHFIFPSIESSHYTPHRIGQEISCRPRAWRSRGLWV